MKLTDLSPHPASSLRLISLEDGSCCNPLGSAEFVGNKNIQAGRYPIFEIRQGGQSGDLFLGIIAGADKYYLPSSNFSKGGEYGK